MKANILRLYLLIPVYILLLAIQPGCSSKTVPVYSLMNSNAENAPITGKGVSVNGSWEFRFQKEYNIQKAVINYQGKMTGLNIYSRMDDKWDNKASVNSMDTSPLTIALNVNTDSIKISPEFSGKGHIVHCQFYISKGQKAFTIPLEKPPFIK